MENPEENIIVLDDKKEFLQTRFKFLCEKLKYQSQISPKASLFQSFKENFFDIFITKEVIMKDLIKERAKASRFC